MAAIDFCCTERLGMASVLLRDLAAVVVLEAMTVISSVSTLFCIILVGVRETLNVQLLLSATCISAPTCQKPAGNWFLCCPFNDAACPAAMYCCTLFLLHPSWCPVFCQFPRHVEDVCPSLTLNPHKKQ